MSGEVAQAPAVPRAEIGRRPTRPRRRFPWQPYALVAPAAIFMLVFFVWPAIQALLITFQTSSGQFTLGNLQAMIR
ncbi:MAG TPA: hypothetical protein VKI99_07170, partial [Candidatus Dormibacteraeota bacterium]|nr:hypothetical protein [Candidatus Dormibacteraeota bacterium]